MLAISATGNQMTFDASRDGPVARDLRLLAARLSAFLGAQQFAEEYPANSAV